jgi:hypothetical protein
MPARIGGGFAHRSAVADPSLVALSGAAVEPKQAAVRGGSRATETSDFTTHNPSESRHARGKIVLIR